MNETPDLLAALARSIDTARDARRTTVDRERIDRERAERASRDAELRDRLDALDDAQTEAVLDTALRNAPDRYRALLRELSLIDPDAVTDALNETEA